MGAYALEMQKQNPLKIWGLSSHPDTAKASMQQVGPALWGDPAGSGCLFGVPCPRASAQSLSGVTETFERTWFQT